MLSLHDSVVFMSCTFTCTYTFFGISDTLPLLIPF